MSNLGRIFPATESRGNESAKPALRQVPLRTFWGRALLASAAAPKLKTARKRWVDVKFGANFSSDWKSRQQER
jgi:hypothetical protein